jgi:hypothetical protein
VEACVLQRHEFVHLAAVEHLNVAVAHQLLVPRHGQGQCLLICQLNIRFTSGAAIHLQARMGELLLSNVADCVAGW